MQVGNTYIPWNTPIQVANIRRQQDYQHRLVEEAIRRADNAMNHLPHRNS